MIETSALWASPRDPTIVLGTMNFGRRTPEAEARRIVERARELGIRHFDTANAYTDGESERILGRALAGCRDEVAIATKVGFARIGGRSEGLSRARVVWALDESLERLGTDHVELYYLHQPDPSTPIEDTLEGVKEVLDSGKARAWAVSNYASWQVLELIGLARMNDMPPPIANQVVYNLLVRQIEIEYLPFAARYGIHTTVYNPLAGGLLTGRYAIGDQAPKGSRFFKNAMYQRRYFTPRMIERVEALGALAAQHGLGLVELAYAWLAGRAGVGSILVGPGELAHLEAAVSAVGRRLSDALVSELDHMHAEAEGTDVRYAR